jgi:hypothetical protein
MDDIEKNAPVVSVITRVENSALVDQGELSAWLVRLSIDGYRCAGFWSGEILPPGRAQNDDWMIVQRFSSMDRAKKWQQSDSRKLILDRFKEIGGADKGNVIDEISSDGSIGNAVTAIVTHVKPDMEDDYWQWEHKIQAAQAKFAGYGGVYVQPPPPGKPGQWTTLLRFDSPNALEKWFDAPERIAILAEANKFVTGFHFHKIESSFPGWIPDLDKNKSTPAWKGATMVVIGLFPILIMLKKYFGPLVASFVPILSMAVSTVLSVALVSFVTMPLLVKLFGWWLAPDSEHATPMTDIKGFAIALIILGLEVLAGWLVS